MTFWCVTELVLVRCPLNPCSLSSNENKWDEDISSLCISIMPRDDVDATDIGDKLSNLL